MFTTYWLSIEKTFSARDEIGTYSNTEVDLQVIDKLPFLLDHFMLKKKMSQ